MDEATQWMRVIGALALVTPYLMSRIPGLRRHAGLAGRITAALYIGTGIAFVLWYLLIRVPPVAG